jgi:hypothetical protein
LKKQQQQKLEGKSPLNGTQNKMNGAPKPRSDISITW